MKSYNRKYDPPLCKGQMFIDKAGWVGIVVSPERTKKYSEYNIIDCVEIFGFYHETGSKYANEIIGLLNESEYNEVKTELGFANEKHRYTGKLIGY